jgi:hypothetical protein
MRRTRVVNASNVIAKKKRHLHEYFDMAQYNQLTPNQRSLPKSRHYVNPNRNYRSPKKDHLSHKRLSQGKVERQRLKENISLHRAPKQGHKHQRFEHSINR